MKQKVKKRKKSDYKLLLYILPGIFLVTILNYLPLWGWSVAFVEYKPGISVWDSKFVGWRNFKFLFGNSFMRGNLVRVLKNTIGMQLLSYLFSPLPMIFAVLLSEVRSKKFQKVVQTVTTLPNFISWVIMLSLANSIFGASGLINTMLQNWGSELTVNVLTTDKHVWLTQCLLGVWKTLGWSAIIYFAAIAGIDQELYEAAMVDGAGRYHKIRYITIPMLIPTYFVLLIMSIGNFLSTGLEQFLAFGNALNKEHIEVLDLYVYNIGLGSGQISYGVAVGMMKTVVAIVLLVTANVLSKKVRGESVF